MTRRKFNQKAHRRHQSSIQPKQNVKEPNQSLHAPPPAKLTPNISSPTPSRPNASPSTSFFSNMLQGFSFGSGSALAHQFVHSIFGSSNDTPQQKENKENPGVNLHTSPPTQEQLSSILVVPYECSHLKEFYTQCLGQDSYSTHPWAIQNKNATEQNTTTDTSNCKQIYDELQGCVENYYSNKNLK